MAKLAIAPLENEKIKLKDKMKIKGILMKKLILGINIIYKRKKALKVPQKFHLERSVY